MAPETDFRSDDVVALLASVPERISDLAGAFDDPHVDYRHAPAFPTLREVIGHVCHAGSAVDALLRQAYLDQQRELAVRATMDPSLEADLSLPLPDLLQRFGRVRRRTVDLLRGLSEQDWEQAVFDPQQGELTILEVCGQVAQHELAHISQLRNLIAVMPDP